MKRCLRCNETFPADTDYCPTDGGRLIHIGKDALIGLVLDKTYKIAGRIGRGGMGAVYVARHQKLPKLFAIKVIRPDLATDEDSIYRFERELRLLASLDHPNIVPITDGGINESKTPHERIFYMVMKHIDGKSLGEILDLEKQLPVERVVHLGRQICAGIAAAHQAGIIHRDLKPDNVMIEKIDEQEIVRVVDFGIAISKDDDQRLTNPRSVIGTPSYLSPERLKGADADYTSDTYALGLIFYEMLSGQHPFTAITPEEMASKHLYETPRPLHEICPAIPAPLVRVVMKALEKDPSRRQQSVKELANDLAAALKVEPARVLTPDEVFIAYSNDDANEVFEVAQQLRTAGLRVWLDKGSDAAEISRAIRECKVVMVMCSDAGLRSRKVKQEMLAAWQHDKYYLPVLLKPTSFQSYFTDWLSGNSCVEIAGNVPQHWLPYLVDALEQTGVASPLKGQGRRPAMRGLGAMPGRANSDFTTIPSEYAVRAMHPSSNLAGLRWVAGFTDQLWPMPATQAQPLAHRTAFRGLGAPQEDVEQNYRIGSRVRLTLESDREGYLILINEGADGIIYCLCPSLFASNPYLQIGSGSLPQANSLADAFVITGKPGREQLLAIIADEPFPFNWMTNDPRRPARVLSQADIEDAMKWVRRMNANRWIALSTYFDVTA